MQAIRLSGHSAGPRKFPGRFLECGGNDAALAGPVVDAVGTVDAVDSQSGVAASLCHRTPIPDRSHVRSFLECGGNDAALACFP